MFLYYVIILPVAAIAQLVERIHGKDEVPGSNPGRGSIFLWKNNPGIKISGLI